MEPYWYGGNRTGRLDRDKLRGNIFSQFLPDPHCNYIPLPVIWYAHFPNMQLGLIQDQEGGEVMMTTWKLNSPWGCLETLSCILFVCSVRTLPPISKET